MSNEHPNRRDVLCGIAAAAPLAALPRFLRAAAEPAVNFLVVGDWGRDGSNHQREVATQMGKAAAAAGSRFVVSVGDNFYENGVASATDPQWRSSFEAVYVAPSLQVPWYVALGNHDYRGTPQAQIDYAKTSPRWRMPSRYYKVAGSEIGAPYLDLFFIDSSPLVHTYRDKVEGHIAANVATQDVKAQLRWLDAELGRSAAPWKLVIGHHTVHSGGSAHGDTVEMVELIEPLLKKHRVQAYIGGHDHDLQHIRRGGVDFIGSGAGSEVRPVAPVEGTLFCAERSGFASITSSADALRLEFWDFTGARLYQGSVSKG
ncbi:MAG: tartrate-resistant acid phosphatase type 5 family protein [Pseudomonadota bacterium]|nr:tartrate-resistant acid phosphatase type 5 family protein [Pseudomonadota bacterium]